MSITYNQFFDAAADGLKMGPDRHPKWVKVDPGHVIPAGQPYRVEYPEMLPESLASDQHGILAVDYDGLNLPFKPFQRSNFVETSRWFVDSSWKPTLVLPTEPTWGIAVINDAEDEGPIDWIVDRWVHENPKYDPQLRMSGHHTASLYGTSEVLDFIPLTDEQITRLIEATR